eukprot:128515-Chlamydomonas_euryale.AAC.3
MFWAARHVLGGMFFAARIDLVGCASTRQWMDKPGVEDSTRAFYCAHAPRALPARKNTARWHHQCVRTRLVLARRCPALAASHLTRYGLAGLCHHLRVRLAKAAPRSRPGGIPCDGQRHGKATPRHRQLR